MPASRGFFAITPRSSHSRRPLPIADRLPAFPTGTTIQSGTRQPRSWTASHPIVFCPSMRTAFFEFRRKTGRAAVSSPTRRMQPSKSVSRPSVVAPYASAWLSCSSVIFPCRQEDDGAHAGHGGGVSGERRRRVARRGARDGLEPRGARPRNADRHAAVLEGERRVLALVLDEEPREGELLAEGAARVEPRRALGLAHDAALRQVREHVLAEAPDAARLEGPRRLRVRRRAPPVEEVLPGGAGPAERVKVGDDVEETAAGRAGRARLGEREGRAARDAPERGQALHAARRSDEPRAPPVEPVDAGRGRDSRTSSTRPRRPGRSARCRPTPRSGRREPDRPPRDRRRARPPRGERRGRRGRRERAEGGSDRRGGPREGTRPPPRDRPRKARGRGARARPRARCARPSRSSSAGRRARAAWAARAPDARGRGEGAAEHAQRNGRERRRRDRTTARGPSLRGATRRRCLRATSRRPRARP